jgi:S1-C subfamily serine protease
MMTYRLNDEQVGKKKKRTRWLIGCSTGAVVIICLTLFIIFGGYAGLMALFGGDPEGLNVGIQTPSSDVQVGDTFTVTVLLGNEGTKNITVSEVRLPNDLLGIALVTDVHPQSEQGLDYGDQTAYEFDLTIAPTGQEMIKFTFQALEAGDVSGDLDVVVGTKSTETPISLAISSGTVSGEGGQDVIQADFIPYRSVVQIVAIVDIEGDRVEGWSGSGTIISEDGLILTNAHVVLSDRYYQVVDLVVLITVAEDQLPEPMFYADVIQADAGLDLAVIKIRSTLDGGAPNFSALGIIPVPLGDSNALQLGDDIVIIGYPGIGGDTITLTRGEVSGFTAEDPYGNRAFIKTSATIAGGNSGGLAATAQGEIIGVPTQVGSGDLEGAIVDCRPLADTNRDGYIDDSDNCVPTGGFINAVRPIDLALPMIEAAKAGEVAIIEEQTTAENQEEYNPEGKVILSDDFSSNVNNWNLGYSSDGSVEITGGQLVIDVNLDSYIVWSDLPDTYNSVIMTVNTNVLQSAFDGDYGFVCGMKDMDNFIGLEVAEDGYYGIWKYQDNEYSQLVDWTYSDTVALGGPFSLAVYCGPDRIALAANGMLLAETVDYNYTPGRVGLIAGCFNYPNLSVGFDDFVIYQP